MPTIEEIKLYLGIDGGWLDPLLADLLKLAQGIIEKVLRYPLTEFEEIPPTIKESAKFISYEVKVAKEDMGKVIGKQGKMAKAIRTVMKSIAVKENKKVNIEFLD